ncbi:MAG TPA: DNA polymerase III subunit delta [Bdellovibrionota bacterium]|jgi:DNA polymerase-3 subunit delta
MANLSESKLKEELQKGKLRSLYVIIGEDAFKLDYYAERALRVLFPDGQPVVREVVYGDEIDAPALLDSARTLSLWDPHKFILVRQAEKVSAKNWEILMSLLESPPERCTILFQSFKADGRMKFFQNLAKAGEQFVQVKLDPSAGGEWSKWLQAFLKDNDKELSADARALLQEWTGGSLTELKHLVDRAALYAGGATEIRREHVSAVGYRTTPEDIFRLSGAILAGDRASVLVLMETLMRQGEEPVALVGLIARQYRWLLGILALRAEGKADAAIASECGIFPMAAKVLFPASRRLGGKGVVRGLVALADADHSLKSSRLPREHVLTKLALTLTA